VATFYNRYKSLASLEFGTMFVDPVNGQTVVPVLNQNLGRGNAVGIETLLTFSPYAHWRLSATHSYINLSLQSSGQDLNRGTFFAGATPHHQFGVRSFLDLPASLQFDAEFRHLSAIRRLPPVVTGEGIPGYSELDARLAWRGWERMEISVVGRNFVHAHQVEFGPPDSRGEIKRSVYGKIAWGF
jgi:iron complex outermembrane recepter protein